MNKAHASFPAKPRTIVFNRYQEPLIHTSPDEVGEYEEFDPLERQMRDLCTTHSPRNTRRSFITGPFGVLSLSDRDDPGRNYNLWVFHTNFNISVPVMRIIEATEGIVDCVPWSRYHGRIAIGRLFDAEVVQEKLRHALTYVPKPPTPKEFALKAMSDTLSARKADWIIIEDGKGELVPHVLKDRGEADPLLLLQKQKDVSLRATGTSSIIKRSWESLDE